MVPSYIITEDGRSISVANFTPEQLTQLGQEWIAKLIKRAEQLKNQ